MRRLILDTNIYGELVIDKDIEKIRDKIKRAGAIYGVTLIRNELRATPTQIRLPAQVQIKNLRIALLSLFDEITKSKNLEINSKINKLSGDYYSVYHTLGGNKAKKAIENDFSIVACAAFNNLDVVVSEDSKTLLSTHALKAYSIVNNI
ncbi:MAG: hypothetical protein HY513_04875, partial [Candidatus Aenigmarchaeota archaeon]|nr:hypothetical protein [Candidatus Aenigmarchaeota archaeon]